MLSLYTVRARETVHRTPRCEEWAERRDRRVQMHGQRNAGIQRGTRGVHAKRAIRANGKSVVLIPPIKLVVGEKIDAHPEGGHAGKLRAIRQLAMLQNEAVIV